MTTLEKETQVLFLAKRAMSFNNSHPKIREALNELATKSLNAAIADKARQLMATLPKDCLHA